MAPENYQKDTNSLLQNTAPLDYSELSVKTTEGVKHRKKE